MEREGQSGPARRTARLTRDREHSTQRNKPEAAGQAGAAAPRGEALKQRIAELRSALAELRADNVRNARGLCQRLIALSMLGYLSFGTALYLLSGGHSSSFPALFLGMQLVSSLSIFQFALFDFHTNWQLLDARKLQKHRVEMAQAVHLDRIRHLNGSGLAERLISGTLDFAALRRRYWIPAEFMTGLPEPQKAVQELKQLLINRTEFMAGDTGSNSLPYVSPLIPLFAAWLLYIAFPYSPAGIASFLLGLLILATSYVLTNRNYWRAQLPLMENYLDQAFDFYERHGSMSLNEDARKHAPPEILGTRQPLSMEALCGELRAVFMLGRDKELGSAGIHLLASGIAAILAPPLILTSMTGALPLPLWAGWFVIMIIGLLFHGVFTMPERLEAYRNRYARRIRERGLFEQWIAGILPVDDLHNSAPAWLHNLLSRPAIPQDLSDGLSQRAWLLMWNIDWFLKGEGSSIRPDWLAQLAPLGVALLAFTALLPGYLGEAAVLPWLICYSSLALGLGFWGSAVILRHRAGALAMLEVLEERLVEGRGSESRPGSAFGISKPGLGDQ